MLLKTTQHEASHQGYKTIFLREFSSKQMV